MILPDHLHAIFTLPPAEAIHFNPVKRGLVTRVRDWPYSSFHRYVRQGLLTDDWAGDLSESGQAYGERGD